MNSSDTAIAAERPKRAGFVRKIGMAFGPLLFLVTVVLSPPDGLTPVAWSVAGMAAWMAVWWTTEAVPLPATSLLPIVLIPAIGAGSVSEATEPYANRLVFLFLGGFLIALTVERWHLHQRVALAVLSRLPGRPGFLVGGFMAVAAFLSMWLSNVATTVMLLSIGASIILLMAENRDGTGEGFPRALMLGLAYACSIGGVSTLIGTAPIAMLAGIMDDNHGIYVGFAEWTVAALPFSLAMLVVGWFVLCRVVCRLPKGNVPGVHDLVANRYRELGSMTSPEWRVALVAGLTVLLWLSHPVIEDILAVQILTDSGIAIGAALLLFAIPSGTSEGGRLLDWETAKRTPWDVLILFGGSLSMAHAMQVSGLAAWIGQSMESLVALPLFLVIGVLVLAIVFLTEFTSNTAASATFIPIAAAMAPMFGVSPIELAAPVAVAASCAFMLPVATPSNAIVFSRGDVTIAQMAQAGFLINLAAVVLITLYVPWAIRLIFG